MKLTQSMLQNILNFLQKYFAFNHGIIKTTAEVYLLPDVVSEIKKHNFPLRLEETIENLVRLRAAVNDALAELEPLVKKK